MTANGDRYEGMWLDDQKEGPGKFIYKMKRQMYEGEWSRGLPKCGTLVDLPPLPGQLPRKYPIPEVKLADPRGILERQKLEIQEERMVRMMEIENEGSEFDGDA
ncbi:MORN repeat-containing protein 3 [Blyttiomyces sp. JEL0837]|nr:MORN repeat-containing protein 3 [Blyttiomyces sp. JEL0837]